MGGEFQSLLKDIGLPSAALYGLGWLTPIFKKSVEQSWKNRSERRRLRHALYVEFGRNFEQLVGYLIQLSQPISNFGWLNRPLTIEEWEQRQVFEDALKNKPILYNELPETKVFGEFYAALTALKGCSLERQMKAIPQIHLSVLEKVKAGTLSRRKMQKHCSCPGSPFRSQAQMFIERKYREFTVRNIPKDGQGHGYRGSTTLAQKLKAIWTGLPGLPIIN